MTDTSIINELLIMLETEPQDFANALINLVDTVVEGNLPEATYRNRVSQEERLLHIVAFLVNHKS